MTISYDVLQEKRVALRSFRIQLLPNEVTNDDHLGLVDQALRINDTESRKKFCKLAIELFNANIDFHSSAATPIDIPSDSAQSVVSVALPVTLIFAGVAFYLWGPAIALVAAGVSYWFSATTTRNHMKQTKCMARDHNSEVADWQETIKGWQKERDLLTDLLFKCDVLTRRP